MNSSSQPDLQALRALISYDPSTTDPHYFLVYDHLKVLADQNRLHPDLKEEVMPQFPRFAADGSSRHSYPYRPPSAAADRLRPYASLTRRFSAMAFAEIDQIEAELAMHGDLPIAIRSRHQLRLQKLTDSRHPVWENWILSLDPHRYNTIDHEVYTWLKEPIDWDEADLFKEDWEDSFYGAKSAKEFFEQLKPQVLEFVGIELGDFTITASNKPLALYQLTIPMREANSRAKSLGLKCRFKGWQGADGALRPPRKPERD